MDSIITFCAKYLFIAVIIIWLWAWIQSSRKNKIELSLSTVIAFIIAAVLDKLLSKLYYDPRPFVSHHLTPLIHHTADNGFPSEHTLFSVTLAAVLIFYRPKLAYLALVMALIVGLARVAASLHSPIDIVGGAAIALLAVYAGRYLAIRLLKYTNSSELK
ncbi:MAG TPA: phosphatase PAP2 family protein [Candidatus Babeliales bacterium]|nr:phosphatase PAP2 family protein [Candidatus Babeliales bacterium]